MNRRLGFGSMGLSGRAFGAVLLALVFNGAAHAQWIVVNLHPAGWAASHAYAVSDGKQAGWVATGGGSARASVWTGSAGSWVDLNPAGSSGSYAYGAGDGQQVGNASVSGSGTHASLWSGTAGSWVDLKPAGWITSYAYSAGDGQQAGYVLGGGSVHASLWSGTSASFVDLHPGAEWTYSYAFGVNGGQQVGFTYIAGPATVRHASLWTGSAASWVDLNPAGALSSQANGVGDGQQVGYARFVNYTHACMWSGTAASWVDLGPAGAISDAYGAGGGQQVGEVEYLSGPLRASLWSGTAASRVDLHALLPAAFSSSTASGIWHDADFTYVVGWGHNDTTFGDQALMWVAAHKFGPAGFSIFRGTLVSGGLPELLESDDQRLVVKNGLVVSPQEPPITVRLDVVAPFVVVSDMKIRLEAQVTTPGLEQGIDLFDYIASDWVNVDARNASFGADGVVTVTVTNPNRFIQETTRAMRAQVTYRKTGLTLSSSWQAKIDQVRWELTP